MYKMKLAIVLLVLKVLLINCELNPDNVIVAINCGGESFKDSRGLIYEKVKFKFYNRTAILMEVNPQISVQTTKLNQRMTKNCTKLNDGDQKISHTICLSPKMENMF